MNMKLKDLVFTLIMIIPHRRGLWHLRSFLFVVAHAHPVIFAWILICSSALPHVLA